MSVVRYTDSPLRCVWKPHHIPSTFGKEQCRLDVLIDQGDPYLRMLMDRFDRQQEYGLLNRLDNETAGLLYFASNQQVYDIYKTQQQTWSINKWYIADVVGRVRSAFGSISTAIEHHPDDDRRMRITQDAGLSCQTHYEVIDYDDKRWSTTVMVRITKGVRHQIRVHFHSLGHPIVGDCTYINKSLRKQYDKNWLLYQDSYLHLWSIGVSFDI